MSGLQLRWMHPTMSADDRATALATISPAERQRYDTTSAPHRDSFLAGRWMLRSLAAQMTSVSAADVALRAVCDDCGGPHGKPFVEGSRLQLSLSHSAHAVVAAAAWHPVGVDVEPLEQAAAVTSALRSLTGDGSITRWTRVEAVLKADGRGLRVDPGQVSLTEADGVVVGRVMDATRRYAVREVALAPGITVSVAEAI